MPAAQPKCCAALQCLLGVDPLPVGAKKAYPPLANRRCGRSAPPHPDRLPGRRLQAGLAQLPAHGTTRFPGPPRGHGPALAGRTFCRRAGRILERGLGDLDRQGVRRDEFFPDRPLPVGLHASAILHGRAKVQAYGIFLLAAYLLTLPANFSRIICALILGRTGLAPSVLTGRPHLALGTFVYFLFLVAGNGLAGILIRGWNRRTEGAT